MVIEPSKQQSLPVVNVFENRAAAKKSDSEPQVSNLSDNRARDHWTKTRQRREPVAQEEEEKVPQANQSMFKSGWMAASMSTFGNKPEEDKNDLYAS